MELKPTLQVDSLYFRFDTRVVFERFNLRLQPGLTWLRGANGAGKTTLMKLLAGALAPNSGVIRMAGIDSNQQALRYRQNSFYCGGDTPELPWLRVQEFLDLHVALYPAADIDLLNRQLNVFNMMSALPQSVTTLSLGENKKLQLALALTLPVRLLLIDEPFNGLDAEAMVYLRQQLTERAEMENSCIVLTSHLDPELPVKQILDISTHN